MTDPIFPALHGRPARGWINDPNGLSRFGDRYHVFFQHNPDAPTHGAIAWGHVSSTDLLTWRVEPVALRPRPGEVDAAGCWSGSVTDDAGVPTAVYTAVADDPGGAWATLARGDAELRHWTPGPAVIARPDDPEIAEVRDPFVFGFGGADGDHRYVVQGGGRPEPGGRPRLLVYRADDLEHWVPLGSLLTDDDPVAATVAEANIWECPNLFPLGDRWVVLISLWRAPSATRQALHGVRFLVGDLHETDDGPRFTAESGGTLDLGPAFYAPQVLVEPDRVLLWGWSWELDRSDQQVAEAGWAGALTVPRELDLVDRTVVARPAAELVGWRSGPLDLTRPVPPGAFEVLADTPVGLTLRTGDHEVPVLDPSVFGGGPARVLVDGSLVEAFGATNSYTTRAYPTADSVWVITGDAGTLRGFTLAVPDEAAAG